MNGTDFTVSFAAGVTTEKTFTSDVIVAFQNDLIPPFEFPVTRVNACYRNLG